MDLLVDDVYGLIDHTLLCGSLHSPSTHTYIHVHGGTTSTYMSMVTPLKTLLVHQAFILIGSSSCKRMLESDHHHLVAKKPRLFLVFNFYNISID
mgnify:CR=1 FL=1